MPIYDEKEMVDSAVELHFDELQMHEAVDFFLMLSDKTHKLFDYFMQNKHKTRFAEKLNHYIFLNLKSVINIADSTLEAISNAKKIVEDNSDKRPLPKGN
jgi:hypothetical protein